MAKINLPQIDPILGIPEWVLESTGLKSRLIKSVIIKFDHEELAIMQIELYPENNMKNIKTLFKKYVLLNKPFKDNK